MQLCVPRSPFRPPATSAMKAGYCVGCGRMCPATDTQQMPSSSRRVISSPSAAPRIGCRTLGSYPGAHRGQGTGADTPASNRVLPLVRYWGGGQARGNPQLPNLYPPPRSSHRTREPVTLVIANGCARSISLSQAGYGRGVVTLGCQQLADATSVRAGRSFRVGEIPSRHTGCPLLDSRGGGGFYDGRWSRDGGRRDAMGSQTAVRGPVWADRGCARGPEP